MKRVKRGFIVMLCLFVWSCAKEPAADRSFTDEDENRWIYSVMSTQYLYNDYTKQVTPNYDQPSTSFFTRLLSPRPTDNDGKHSGEQNYYYSYMERTGLTKGLAGSVLTYGIDYQGYILSDSYAVRVLYVVPNSSASRAGIQRGDWIVQLNGANLNANDMSRFKSGGAATWLVGEMNDYEVTNLRSVRVEAASVMEISPIFKSSVIVRGDRRIGYLVYNVFESGPGGVPNYTYDNELKNTFAELKQQQVNELVVDLRYNPGGYLTSCQLLCSMIAPEEALGQLFCTSRYNAELHARYGEVQTYFHSPSEMAAYNLNLSRLYVLTGPMTASASELLINSLRPYMPVKVIGGITEGKNVGSVEIRSSKFQLALHPITQQAFNKNHESDYANGFVPDFFVDESANLDPMLELGDPNEFVLRYALLAITQPSALEMKRGETKRSSRIVPDGDAVHYERRSGIIITDSIPGL